MKNTILHKLNILHPLKTDYQIIFLKHIINELEENGTEEIHDSIYEELAAKLKEEKPEFSYKHFQIPKSQAITVKESNSFIRDGTTGLKLWPAALVLSEFILQNPEEFNEKSILEIGSGAQGFVGLTTIRACKPLKLFLSDCHETVLEHLIENINLNLEQEKPRACSVFKSLLVREKLKINDGPEIAILNLPWEETHEVESELKDVIVPDTLIAADVVYDESIFESLLRCINTCFKLSGPSLKFFLAQPVRNLETFEKFCNLLFQNKFSIFEESLSYPTFFNLHFLTEKSSEIKILRISRNLFE